MIKEIIRIDRAARKWSVKIGEKNRREVDLYDTLGKIVCLYYDFGANKDTLYAILWLSV